MNFDEFRTILMFMLCINSLLEDWIFDKVLGHF